MAASIRLWILSCFLAKLVNTEDLRMLRFSTKTGYKHLKTHELGDLTKLTQHFDSGCKPLQINMLLRHGSRQPNKKWAVRFKDVLSKLQGNIQRDSFSHLNTMPLRYTPDHQSDMNLVDVGKQEHAGLGQRIGSAFSSIFNPDLADANMVHTISSSKGRARESAKTFMDHFRQTISHSVNVKYSVNDDMLRFFDNCNKYVKGVDTNTTALGEYHKFKSGPEMRQIAGRVSQNLGLTKQHTLTGEDVYAVYQLCAYDVNLYNDHSWCDLFTHEDFEVLEYAADLKQYWLKSYGYDINYKQSCPVLADVITHMEQAVKYHHQPSRYARAVLRFGHAETLLPFLTLLGLYNDTNHLLATNFNQMKDRKFRASLVSPMAGNVLVVLYKCQPDQNDISTNSASDFYVQVYVNEKLEKLPGCDNFMCSWENFRKLYMDHATCPFHNLCENDKHDEL